MIILELQPLTLDFLPAALELDRRCLGGLWNADGYRREIESPNSDLLVVVLQDRPLTGGESSWHGVQSDLQPPRLAPATPSLLALGCSWTILEEAHITLLAVDPDYQRQGLGQLLIWALLKTAHTRGLERATLEVRRSNQAAIALYEKFGFREAGRRKRYYQDNGEDALVLWRGGLQHPHFTHELETWRETVGDRLFHSGWQLDPDADAQRPSPVTPASQGMAEKNT